MVKEKLQSIQESVRNNSTIKAGRTAAITAGLTFAFPFMAFAGDGVLNFSKVENVTVDELFDRITEMIGTIFKIIGAILLFWAIGQLALAFKNEDADSKTRAIMLMVVSIILISLNSIYNAVIGKK